MTQLDDLEDLLVQLLPGMTLFLECGQAAAISGESFDEDVRALMDRLAVAYNCDLGCDQYFQADPQRQGYSFRKRGPNSEHRNGRHPH